MQKQTCLKKVTKSGGKRLSHLLIDKADNAKDFSIRFKRMVGLKLLPSFFEKSLTIYTLSAFGFLVNGYYSIMALSLTICCFYQEFT